MQRNYITQFAQTPLAQNPIHGTNATLEVYSKVQGKMLSQRIIP